LLFNIFYQNSIELLWAGWEVRGERERTQ